MKQLSTSFPANIILASATCPAGSVTPLMCPLISALAFLPAILQKANLLTVTNVNQIQYFQCSSTFSSFSLQNIVLFLLWPTSPSHTSLSSHVLPSCAPSCPAVLVSCLLLQHGMFLSTSPGPLRLLFTLQGGPFLVLAPSHLSEVNSVLPRQRDLFGALLKCVPTAGSSLSQSAAHSLCST